MEEITAMQNEELQSFIKQAKAIISNDIDKLFKSGFLDIDDYKDSEGNLEDGYEDSALDSYSQELLYKSRPIMTAYEVDKDNKKLGKFTSISGFDNINKSYLMVTLKGDHVYGDIILSNTNDVFIQAFDKSYNQLHFDRFRKLDDDHQLTFLANHLAGGEEEFKNHIPERNIDELAHFFKLADSEYTDQGELKEFRLDMLRQIHGQELGFPVDGKKVTDDLKSELKSYNSILFKDGVEEKENSFIYEIDGNIFYHESTKVTFGYDSRFEFVEEGDEFTFKGETFIAEPGILKSIEMSFDYETISNNIDEDYEEPAVKRKIGFKP